MKWTLRLFHDIVTVLNEFLMNILFSYIRLDATIVVIASGKYYRYVLFTT